MRDVRIEHTHKQQTRLTAAETDEAIRAWLTALEHEDLNELARRVLGPFDRFRMPDGTTVHLRPGHGLSYAEVVYMHERMKDECPVCRGERPPDAAGEAVLFTRRGKRDVRLARA